MVHRYEKENSENDLKDARMVTLYHLPRVHALILHYNKFFIESGLTWLVRFVLRNKGLVQYVPNEPNKLAQYRYLGAHL